MIPRHDIDGLVLAGGMSRRMQREGESPVDKGLLSLQGEPLVQWVVRYMAPWVDSLYISANRHIDVYGRYGQCVVDDPIFGGDAGPLAGVASAMACSQRPWLLVLPVDVPRLPADLPLRLVEAASAGAPVAYASAGGGAHPLCMLVRRDLAGDLKQYLLDGGRKVLDWHRRHGAVSVDFGGDTTLFSNINTPEDWKAAGGLPGM